VFERIVEFKVIFGRKFDEFSIGGFSWEDVVEFD
jgi:hypothetical protein